MKTWQKIIATLLTLLVLAVVFSFLVELFYPNWLTGMLVVFLTVTIPGWISTGTGMLTTFVSGIAASIGSIFAIKRNATNQIATVQADAQTQVSQANGNVNALLTENQQLTNTVAAKDTQITDLNAKLAESQNSLATIEQQKQQIQTLTQANQLLMDKLAHTPVNVVEVVK